MNPDSSLFFAAGTALELTQAPDTQTLAGMVRDGGAYQTQVRNGELVITRMSDAASIKIKLSLLPPDFASQFLNPQSPDNILTSPSDAAQTDAAEADTASRSAPQPRNSAPANDADARSTDVSSGAAPGDGTIVINNFSGAGVGGNLGGSLGGSLGGGGTSQMGLDSGGSSFSTSMMSGAATAGSAGGGTGGVAASTGRPIGASGGSSSSSGGGSSGDTVSTGGSTDTALKIDSVVSIAPVAPSVTEGTDTSAVFRVSLDKIAAEDVIINVRSIAGTAGSNDFSPINMSVVVPKGSLSTDVDIPLKDNARYELSEIFQAEIVSAKGSSGGAVELSSTAHIASITVNDNDTAPTVSVSPVTITEGGTATYTVTLDKVSDVAVTGSWQVSAGSANAADFGGSLPGGTFTVPAGSLTATITVPTYNDMLTEGAEDYTLSLSAITNAQNTSAGVIGTINDDDLGVTFAVNSQNVNENIGNASVQILLPQAHGSDITVTYRTVVGSAGNGDYTQATTSTVTIPAGLTSINILVPITDDAVFEGGTGTFENFTVELVSATDASASTIAVTNASHTVQIVDNDTLPSLTMSPVSQTEGGAFSFTVTASNASHVAITGSWEVLAGTANGADFGGSLPTGTFTIPAGSTTATITLTSLDDVIAENNETFTLKLDGILNAQPGPISTIGTIINNDFSVSLTSTPVTVNEGDGTASVEVTLNIAHSEDVTITYRTVRISASGTDFTEVGTGTVTLTAGQTSGTIDIGITNDALYDGGDETFRVEIVSAHDVSNRVVAVVNDTQTVTILDNEVAPTLTMGNVLRLEGQTFAFSVTASHASDSPITGNWSVLAGDANAADFGGTLPTGTFTIPAGSTTATITFASTNDMVLEGNEGFTLRVDNIVGAQTSPVFATGTINNDDFTVGVSAATATVNEAAGTASTVFTISAAHTEDVTVTYRTVAGTAAAGSDYTGVSTATATILAGQTSVTVTTAVTGDAIYDGGNETYQIEIVSAQDASSNNIPVSGGVQTISIVDDELAPALSMGSLSRLEGQVFSFTVTASHASDAAITGDWSVLADAADASDFAGALPAGTFTIPAGSTTATITFSSSNDSVLEGNETFTLRLNNISGAQTTPVLATGTIVNDDFGINVSAATATFNETAGSATTIFTISSAHTEDVTITYRTVTGTAGSADFTTVTTATATILAGQTSVSVTTSLTNDSVYDGGDETYQVEILSAVDATSHSIPIGQGLQTITIVDDELAPTLTMGNLSRLEGASFGFVVTASHASDSPITGNWTVLADGANAADFGGVLPTGTFTIPAGSTTATITFSSSSDSVLEGNETFNLRLDNISGAQNAPVLASGTILNDDFGVNVGAASATINEGDGTLTTVFTISSPSAVDVTITYRTVAGTASGGADYTSANNLTATILAGQTSVSVTTAIINDALYDGGDETFSVEIVSASDANSVNIPVGQATQTVTIVDDETQPVLTMNAVSNDEGEIIAFTVTASRASDSPITGNWAVLAGTADAADFGGTLPSGTFTILAGTTTTTIPVATIEDLNAEANETFTLQLTGITGAQAGPITASGTINNDDFQVYLSQASDTVLENAGNYVARVDLSAVHGTDIVVTYRTIAATAGSSDYTAVSSGTITIAAGALSGNITIPIANDTFYEGNETFRIEIVSALDTNSVVIPLGTSQQTVTIIDNETVPVLSVADVSAVEGVNLVYTLTLSQPSAQTVTGSWEVLSGTATAADFGGTLPSGTFTIPAGSTTATLTISTIDDTTAESTLENFSLRLFNVTNTSQDSLIAQGNISDNDVFAYVTTAGQIVGENAGTASVTFSLNRVHSQDVTVNYRTVTGTATGADFGEVGGASVVIPAGQTSATVTVAITNDTSYEGASESFSVEITTVQDALGSPMTVASNHTHIVTITDNESMPTLTVTPAGMTEGGSAIFTVTASHTSTQDITGTWIVEGDTANTADFGSVFPSGTFTLAAGQVTTTITVASADDVFDEGNETFDLKLDNITGAQAGPVTGTGTIYDNERAVSLDNATATVNENGGTVSIGVTLSQPHTHDITIGYRTVSATATAGDYTGQPGGTITIPAGQTSANITVAITDDNLYDGGAETFSVELLSAVDTNSQSIAIGTATNIVTIVDNESAPTLSMGDITQGEGGTFTFTITASSVSDAAITGNWSVSAGTAAAADFAGGVLPSGTFTIPAGQTTTTLTFNAFDDALQEGVESFTVGLTGISGANTGAVSANGTITDNELSISFSGGTSAISESGGVAPVVITLNQAMARDVTVYYRTTTGTAGSSDFTGVTNSAVVILAGQTTATINIGINDDTIYDGDPEYFNVELISAEDSQGTNVPVNSTGHRVFINDNDALPTLTMSPVTISENGTASFTITRVGSTDEPIGGNWELQAGTANAADFGGTLPSGTFAIPANQNSVTINITTSDDALAEGDETFTIHAFDIVGSSTTDITSAGVIQDNELHLSFSASSGTVAENAGSYAFALNLSSAHTQPITVTYSTISGTAGSSDYTVVTGQTAVISAGQTTINLSVPITDDFVVESTEGFQIRIDSVVDGLSTPIAIFDDTHDITITDDDIDLGVSFLLSSTTVSEGAGSGNVTVRLNQIHSEDVIVTYNTSNDTATSGSDYTGTAGNVTITIPAGQQQVNIPFTILEDTLYEGSAVEKFNINLVSAQDQLSRPVTLTGTTIHEVVISENDQEVLVQFQGTLSNVAEDAGAQTARIVLSRAHTSDITVTYRTTDGTANHGSDYTGTGSGTATIVIAAGQTQVDIPYSILTDSIYEPGGAQSFTVDLISARDASNATIRLDANQSRTVNISDIDVLPELSLSMAPSSEAQDFTFTINLNHRSSQNVTGTWTFQPGQATAPDFDNAGSMPSGTFTIAAGSTTAVINVPVVHDVLIEGYEDFSVRLDNIVGAVTTPVIGTGYLVDDELIVGFGSVSTGTVIEGNSYSATVEMSYASLHDVTVTYEIITNTTNGATANSDFTATTGSLFIAAGQTSGNIIAQVLQDTLNETTEKFKIRLTGVSASGGTTPTLANTEQVIDITDDELDPTVSMSVPGFVNENGGPQIVTIERSTQYTGTSQTNVTFAGTGFTVTYNSVVYNPGQTFTVTFSGFLHSQTITFTPTNNSIQTGDTTVSVTLSDPVRARLPTTSYSISVLDDETPTLERYDYGSPGPVIDGRVHGTLSGDSGRNVLSIGETVIASEIRYVTIDPLGDVDQIRVQTQTGQHLIVDNTVLLSSGRVIVEMMTGAAGQSMVSGNVIHASAAGEDVISLQTLGGKVGQIAGNQITVAEGSFAGADGTNQVTLATLNANAGSTLEQRQVGIIANNLIAGGDGNDIITVTSASNNAGSWSGNSAFLANSGTFTSGITTTALKDGGYFIAGSNGSLYGQFVNENGTTRLDLGNIQSSATLPEAVTLSNGNVVLTYTISTTDIYFRIYTPEGAAVGSAVTVVTSGTTSEPKIAAMTDGTFVLAYADSSNNDVHVKRFSATGTLVTTDTITQAGSESMAAVTALANGTYALTWANTNSGSHDVFMQRYAADNSKIGGIVTVNNGASTQYIPQILGLKDGGFVVAWSDASMQDGYYGVRGTIYNADGTVRAANFLVSHSQYNHSYLRELVTLSNGDFLATFERNAPDFYYDSGVDVFMVRLNAQGQVIGNETRLNYYYSGQNEYSPNIIEMRDGNLLAVYYDSAQGGIVQRSILAPGASIIQGNELAMGDGANKLVMDAQSATGRNSRGDDVYDQNTGGDAAVVRGNRITSGAGVDEIQLSASSGNGGNASSNISNATPYLKQFLVDSITPTSNTDTGVSVHSMADGGFAVVWGEDISSGSNIDVYMQRYDRNGNPLAAQQTIINTSPQQAYPVVTGLPDGGYVVAWTAGNTTIQYQVYNADNTVRLTTQTLDSGGSTDYQPDIETLKDGGFVIVWSEINTNGSYYRTRVARFDENGVAQGDQHVVSPVTSSRHMYGPEVTATSDGGYVIGWATNNSESEWQRFDILGNAVTGVIRSPSNNANYKLEVVALANGNIITLQNFGSTTSYGYLYDRNGAQLAQISFNSNVYRTEAMATTDGGFVMAQLDSNNYISLYRYDATGTLIGQLRYLAASGTTFNGTNDDHSLDMAPVGEDGFVVTWVGGSAVKGALFKFDKSFNLGGDGSVVENNTLSTGAEADSISLSTSGGSGGSAAETQSGSEGSNLVTAAGAASVVRGNVIDSGEGNDTIILSATGGNADRTRIDGLAAQVINNTVVAGDGNDQLNITATGGLGNALSNRVAYNSFDMGAGADSIISTSLRFETNTLALGAGNNSAAITAERFNDNITTSGTGDDTISVTNLRTAHNNSFTLGDGNDSITLTSSSNAFLSLTGQGPAFDNATGNTAQMPRTTVLANGQYVTTWYESASGTSNNVYAQIFAQNGVAVSSVISVAATGNAETYPSVAATSDGGYVIGYQDDSASNYYVKKYDATGTQVGTTTTVPDFGSSIFYSDIAVLTGGKIASVQMSANPSTGGYYNGVVYILNADLTVGSSINLGNYIYNTSSHTYYPTVTATSDGNFVAVFYNSSTGTIGTFKFNSSLSQIWGNTQGSSGLSNSPNYPPRAVELSNGYIMTYWHNGGSAIYGSIQNTSGGYVFSNTNLNSSYGGWPEIVKDANGGFILYGTDGGSGLYRTAYNAGGSQVVPPQLLLSAPTTITQIEVKQLSTGTLIQYAAGDKIYQNFQSSNDYATMSGQEIDLGDGTNSANITTGLFSTSSITSGSGNDTITLSAAAGGIQNAISMGGGTNILGVTGGDFDIWALTGGANRDAFTVTSTGKANRFTVNLGDGVNDLNMTAATSMNVLTYTGTAGIDTLVLAAGTTLNNAIIGVGGNDDSVTATAGTNMNTMALTLGEGANTATLTATAGTMDNATISAGAGNDSFTATAGTNMNTMGLTLGNGANTATLTATAGTMNSATISAGDGNDGVTATSGSHMNSMGLTLGQGENTALLTATGGTMNNLTVSAGALADSLTATSSGAMDTMNVNLDAGTNGITMRSTGGTMNAATVTTLGGADTVSLRSSSTMNNAVINLGDGLNSLTLKSDSSSMTTLGITTTSGNDTVSITAHTGISAATLDLGSGTNNLTMISTTSTIATTNLVATTGNDTVSITAQSNISGTTLDVGAGNNNITLIATAGSITTTGLTTTTGDDTINITAANAINSSTINLGAGLNDFNLNTTTSNGSITTFALTTGADNDTVDITLGSFFSGGTFLVGDGQNTVNITTQNAQAMNSVSITGVDGVDAYDLSAGGAMNNLTLALGNGNNTTTARAFSGTMATLGVTAGTGDDILSFQSSGAMANANVSTSSGNDTLSLTASAISDAVINVGTGVNTANFSGAITNMQYTAGSGTDTINFNAGSVSGGTYNLGIGESLTTVSASVSSFANVTYNAGSNNDVLTINTTATGNTLSLGSGVDTLSMKALGNNIVSLGVQTNVLDTLILNTAGTHNLSNLAGQLTGAEILDLRNSGTDLLTVDRNLAMQADNYGGVKNLFINGNGTDTVNILSGGGTVTLLPGTTEFNSITYRIFEQNEGTPVYFYVQQGVAVTVNGGSPVTFDNPIGADLRALSMDFDDIIVPAGVVTQPQGATASSAATAGDVKVITYALFGNEGDMRLGGALSLAVAQVFAMYQAALEARGVHVMFEELPVTANGSDSMFTTQADIAIGAGNRILSHFVADPDSVLGVSAGQMNEASALLINAPNAPDHLTAAQLEGDIFLSDSFLKLAALAQEHGGGIQPGSLGYYVLTQEIGHSLGLNERTDAEIAENGYDAQTAHSQTTSDETIEGLNGLQDLSGMNFATTPGDADLDRLAATWAENHSAQPETSSFAQSLSDWISRQASADQDNMASGQNDELNQFMEQFFGLHNAQQPGPDMPSQTVANILNWAQQHGATPNSTPNSTAGFGQNPAAQPQNQAVQADAAPHVPTPADEYHVPTPLPEDHQQAVA